MGVAGVEMVKKPFLISIFVLTTLSGWAQELKIRVNTADGQRAVVRWMDKQGQPSLGSTGEVLTFNVDGFRQPYRFDIVLLREDKLPSLHVIEPQPTSEEVWSTEPLPLYSKAHQLQFRTEPQADLLFLEDRNGNLIPSGKDGELTLTAPELLPEQAFQARDVVVVARRSGYLDKRIRVGPEIWSRSLMPPPDSLAYRLDPAPGPSQWWTRIKREHPFAFLFALLFLGVAFVLFRLRLHYLRKVEQAHEKLTRWVERLDTFVDGSQALATPLKMEELVEATLVQAKRLTRGERIVVVSFQPDFNSEGDPSQVEQILEHLRLKPHPLRIGALKESRFGEAADMGVSLLAVPLLKKGACNGGLLAFSNRPGQFSKVDEEALTVLAFQLSGAVERVDLHQQTVTAYEKLAESEQQLIQSAKMAAIGQLAAGVAHELNTPLNAISLGLDMGRSLIHKDPEKADKRLQLAAKATEKAEGIVSKLLYYSREARLDAQKFCLRQVVDDTLHFLNFQLQQDGILIQRGQEPEIWVEGNLNELQQVLNNLLLNARDAVLSGDYDTTLEIRLEQGETMGQLTVLDRGPGVKEEHIDKIFDPFFTTKNMGDGTGLGLSVSAKIMEKHGGTLTYERNRDRSMFTMYIPLSAPAIE